LAQQMQVAAPDSNNYWLDSAFVSRVPTSLDSGASQPLKNHPILKFYQGRIDVSNEQAKYYRTLMFPQFSVFGIGQDRGTGFYSNYGANNLNDYTTNYFKGVSFNTGNYLIGVGVFWDFTNLFREREQVSAQKWNTAGLKEE